MKTTNVLFLMLLVVIYNSCEKSGKKDFYPVSENLKKWAFFDKGSWWLYQEQISGELDSIYVISSEIIQSDHLLNGKYDFTIQNINVNLSNLNKWLISGSYSVGGISMDRNNGSELGRVCLIFEPLQIGKRKGPNGLGYSEITNIQSQYRFDSVYTDTCITILNNRDDLHQQNTVEYKVLRGLGIISKKEKKTNKEWKLIKYKIIMKP